MSWKSCSDHLKIVRDYGNNKVVRMSSNISPEGRKGVPGGTRLSYEGEMFGQLQAGDLHVCASVAPTIKTMEYFAPVRAVSQYVSHLWPRAENG